MTPDEAEKLTDLLLLELEKRITEAYDDALEDITAEIAGYFLKFRKRDAEMQARLDAGEIAADYYRQWRLNQIGRGERLEAMAQQVAARLTDTAVTAAEYINDSLPLVYAENRAWTAYSVDRLTGGALTFGAGSMGIDFTLWDEHTVRRLLREQPEVMPNYPEARAVRRGIDLAYGKSQIHKQVTSSILAGDSIPKMADKLQERITTMSRASAIRAARTAVTSAQNGGRQDGFADAAKMGISVRKRWIATKDMRTRPEHGAADGQTVETDQPFDVGGEALMFPGDPSGSPANIYNCRCTMRSVEPDDIEAEPRMMRVRDANGNSVVVPEMTYDEWKKWVETGELPGSKATMYRRRIASDGHEIIDHPTYNKLTASFIRSGGIIIRGEDAAKMLKNLKASAAYIAGGNVAYIKDDATVSDVLEEMYHAKQDRRNAYGSIYGEDFSRIILLREIDAQKYLQSVADKYKIPMEERKVTESNLAAYERKRDEQDGV